MSDISQIARGVFEELYNRGKLEFIDQNYDPTYKGHDTLDGEFGREQLKKNVRAYRTAFPDLTMRIEDLVPSSNKVLVRWTGRGTHRGPFMGKAPTGKQSSVEGITVITFKNGKISEDWTQWDTLRLLQDLGLAPRVEPPAEQPSP
jgi:steroid delta-isomerase-like uncharacterized protein